MNLEKHYKEFPKLSMIYIDCDLYKTTSKILETLSNKLNKGGLIVFDEANFGVNRGEGKAAKEFYKKNLKNHDNNFFSHQIRWDQYLMIKSFFNIDDEKYEKKLLENNLLNLMPKNFKNLTIIFYQNQAYQYLV